MASYLYSLLGYGGEQSVKYNKIYSEAKEGETVVYRTENSM